MKQILNVAQLDPRSIYSLFGREVNAVFVLFLSGSLEERLAVQNADKAAKVGRDVFFTKKEVGIYA